jgi:hypothetical protein
MHAGAPAANIYGRFLSYCTFARQRLGPRPHFTRYGLTSVYFDFQLILQVVENVDLCNFELHHWTLLLLASDVERMCRGKREHVLRVD